MRFRTGQHVRRPAEIRAIREQGRRIDCGAFTVWWKRRTASTEVTAPRVCVIASTKAVGSAVRRNRAKRRLREIFRRHQNELPADSDLLLIAKGATNTWRFSELEAAFLDACRRIADTRT